MLSILGIALAGAIFVGVLGLGVALELGYFPDTVAVAKEDLPEHVVRTLRDAGIVAEDEDVLFYYGGGLLDYLEDGNLFTDRRVISYWSEDGEVMVEDAAYAQVADIVADYADSWLLDSEVTVTRADGTQFVLFVAAEDGGDREFVRRLRSTWQRSR